MRWHVLASKRRGASALDGVVDVVQRSRIDRGDPLHVAPGATGIAVVGSDADLAHIALQLTGAEHKLPIALIPTGSSDLLRMFGLDRDGMLRRLEAGGPYPTDLGICQVSATRHPFVGSVVAQPPLWVRHFSTSPVSVHLNDRVYDLDAWEVAVANAQHVAGRTYAPRAAVMDGDLDAQVFGGRPAHRPGIRRSRRAGLHLRSSHVWRRTAATVNVQIPASWRVAADLMTVGNGAFGVEIAPGAFDLWI